MYSTPFVMRVDVYRDARALAQSTGSFYLQRDRAGRELLHLVTVRHVVEEGARDGERMIPAQELRVNLALTAAAGGGLRELRIPLYTRTGAPTWLGPDDAHGAPDVLIVPLPAEAVSDCRLAYLEAASALGHGGALQPLTSIHVVGFPVDHYDEVHATPVYQTGVLAADGSQDFRGQPCIPVEMATYPGMAGAPAFAVEADPRGQGAMRRFLGIYSGLPIAGDGRHAEAFIETGRAGVAARDAAIWGRIWKARVIEELLGDFDAERWEREVLAEL